VVLSQCEAKNIFIDRHVENLHSIRSHKKQVISMHKHAKVTFEFKMLEIDKEVFMTRITQWCIRVIFLMMVLFGIQGCQSIPQTRELVDKNQMEQAKQFVKYSEYANVYFYYMHPSITTEAYFNVYIDGIQVTQLQGSQFINLKAIPGKHHFKITALYPKYPKYNKTIAEFDLKLEKGSRPLIACDKDSLMHKLEYYSGYRMISPNSACDEGGMGRYTTADGVTVCTSPYVPLTRGLDLGGITYKDNDHRLCLLSDVAANESLNNFGLVMVKADVDIIKANDGESDFKIARQKNTVAAYQDFLKGHPSGKYHKEAQKLIEGLIKKEYLQAERTHTVVAYKQFLNNHPSGRYSDIIRGKIQVLKTNEQVNAVLQRYAGLPLQVRKDKVMLLLTKHLKHQQYQESLLYFEVLDRMKVKLSSSFDYFWGEALVKTGQKKRGLDKLYAYIRKAGSQGQYYSQALTMSNEAEQQ